MTESCPTQGGLPSPLWKCRPIGELLTCQGLGELSSQSHSAFWSYLKFKQATKMILEERRIFPSQASCYSGMGLAQEVTTESPTTPRGIGTEGRARSRLRECSRAEGELVSGLGLLFLWRLGRPHCVVTEKAEQDYILPLGEECSQVALHTQLISITYQPCDPGQVNSPSCFPHL